MSYAPFNHPDPILGSFREKTYDNLFEFTNPAKEVPVWKDFPVKVWVTAARGAPEFRWAKVLKTVAYVVVDEAADGGPVTEKWEIKNFRSYQ